MLAKYSSLRTKYVIFAGADGQKGLSTFRVLVAVYGELSRKYIHG